jgi:hypothetical protein
LETDLLRRFNLPTFIWLIPLALLILAGITWLNYQYTGRGDGQHDFLPAWTGTRLFFTEGTSPYSEETTSEIQQQAYGRPAKPGEDPLLFTYPLYGILIFAPFALVGNYQVAAALWMSALEISLVLICLTGLSLSRWNARPLMVLVLVIFSITWYPSVQALMDGNPAILCALFITVALWALYEEQDALAAIMLALAFFKPAMLLVLIPLVMIWGFSRKRTTLVWGIPGVLVILTAATSLLVPEWIVQYARMLLEALGQVDIGTPRALFMHWLPGIGTQLAWLLTIISGVILLWEWRQAFGMNFRWFLWTAYLSLAISNLIGIPTSVENQVVLIPALILILAVWDERWGTLGRWLIATSLALLSIGLWWAGLLAARQETPADLAPLVFFAAPITILIGLYWVRWWAIRSSRLPMQEMTERLG